MMGEFLNKLKNFKGLGFIAVGIIAGIILIIIGNLDFTTSESKPVIEPEINYTQELEDKIIKLIERIDGVSGVNVMLTLESGNEFVYAQNRNGEIRDYVVINEADRSETLTIVKEINPQVRGIAVVCIGGNNPVIQSQIINLLSTLFNLSTNRIYVTG
jgi:hypothetical protein